MTDQDQAYCADLCGRPATTERVLDVTVSEHTHPDDATGGDGIYETVELVCIACKENPK